MHLEPDLGIENDKTHGISALVSGECDSEDDISGSILEGETAQSRVLQCVCFHGVARDFVSSMCGGLAHHCKFFHACGSRFQKLSV